MTGGHPLPDRLELQKSQARTGPPHHRGVRSHQKRPGSRGLSPAGGLGRQVPSALQRHLRIGGGGEASTEFTLFFFPSVRGGLPFFHNYLNVGLSENRENRKDPVTPVTPVQVSSNPYRSVILSSRAATLQSIPSSSTKQATCRSDQATPRWTGISMKCMNC